MPEHYTRNTVTATAWCKRCNRDTTHRVDGGRKGPCLECLPPLPKASIPPLHLPDPEPTQGDLFEKPKEQSRREPGED